MPLHQLSYREDCIYGADTRFGSKLAVLCFCLFSSILSQILKVCGCSFIPLQLEQPGQSPFPLGISLLCLHATGIFPFRRTALNRLQSTSMPASPINFYISIGSSSDPVTLPFFWLFRTFFTSSPLTSIIGLKSGSSY